MAAAIIVTILIGIDPSRLQVMRDIVRSWGDHAGWSETIDKRHRMTAGDGLPAIGSVIHGRVRRVADGDSLYLQDIEPQIRLWGLDAPEWNRRGGSAATHQLRQIVADGELACTVMDHDRYRRIVGRCRRGNGSDVAALMIRSGAAREYRRYSGGYYSNIGND